MDKWARLSTATVSDALDRLAIHGQCLGIRPLDRKFKLFGRAYTIRMGPHSCSTPGTVGDYVDEVPAGAVVVIDNGGRLDVSVWGDLLTLVAHQRRLGGTIVHGVCRDSARSVDLGYPIFSRGCFMRTGKDRVQADSHEVAVSLGDVRVEPGDLLLGDADGLVVIPQVVEQQVLAVALEIEGVEEQIRSSIAGGERLDKARQRFGYHQLQRGDSAVSANKKR